jgi:DNA-binding MarR family transcriptional regulator
MRRDADDLERIERSMRAFRRITESQRSQRRMQRHAELDLDSSAFVALVHLAEREPQRLARLAADLWVDPSVISRKVDLLEARGLVRREPDPSDARATLIHVTEEGSAAAMRLVRARSASIGESVADWSAEDRSRFAKLLERFIDDVTARYDRDDS